MDMLEGVSTRSSPFILSGSNIYVLKCKTRYTYDETKEELYQLDLQNKRWTFITKLLLKAPVNAYGGITPLCHGTDILLFPIGAAGNREYISWAYSCLLYTSYPLVNRRKRYSR